MSWYANSAVMIGQGLSVMALVAVCHGSIDRLHLREPQRSLLLGGVFGGGAVLAMMCPAVLSDVVYLDLRAIFVCFAGAFIGPVAMIVAAIMAGACRLLVAGAGAYVGVIVIALAGLTGLIWRIVWGRDREIGAASLAILAVLLSLGLFTLAFHPVPDASRMVLHVWMTTLPAYVIASITFGSLMKREKRLIERETMLLEYGRTDQMTGLPNRHRFVERVQQALVDQKEGGEGFAIFMIDIDHFKNVNDSYGHHVGDEALKAVAHLLGSSFSRWDLAARYGGEEFAVFLPFVSPTQALNSAERLRQSVCALNIDAGATRFAVTISVGVATSFAHDLNIAGLLAEADGALYAAKHGGRNQVRTAWQTKEGQVTYPEVWSSVA